MNRKPKTLGQTMARSLAGALVLFGIAAQPVIWGSNDHVEAIEGHPGVSQVERPVAEGSPQALLEAHDCWTGEAPADMQGVIPGHVVVSIGAVPEYRGATMVGQAFDQIFDGINHGITVHGFCR
jgi:hypothetical protein